MAHKKGGGSGKNGRNSPGQRLGIKAYGSEMVTTGCIIVRQRGTSSSFPALNVRRAKDDTLFAMADGKVQYDVDQRDKKRVEVVPVTEAVRPRSGHGQGIGSSSPPVASGDAGECE